MIVFGWVSLHLEFVLANENRGKFQNLVENSNFYANLKLTSLENLPGNWKFPPKFKILSSKCKYQMQLHPTKHTLYTRIDSTSRILYTSFFPLGVYSLA